VGLLVVCEFWWMFSVVFLRGTFFGLFRCLTVSRDSLTSAFLLLVCHDHDVEKVWVLETVFVPEVFLQEVPRFRRFLWQL